MTAFSFVLLYRQWRSVLGDLLNLLVTPLKHLYELELSHRTPRLLQNGAFVSGKSGLPAEQFLQQALMVLYLLTLSRATSQFCTTRDLIEWARSQFCTISKIRRSSTRSSSSIWLSGNARDIRCRLLGPMLAPH